MAPVLLLWKRKLSFGGDKNMFCVFLFLGLGKKTSFVLKVLGDMIFVLIEMIDGCIS